MCVCVRACVRACVRVCLDTKTWVSYTSCSIQSFIFVIIIRSLQSWRWLVHVMCWFVYVDMAVLLILFLLVSMKNKSIYIHNNN